MEITGKITHALEQRSGTSSRTGNQWVSQTFVIETSDQYPRRCAFDVFGEEKLREFNIQVGQSYTVSIDLDAREYQGRWYNSVRAWRVAPAATAMSPEAYGAAPSPIPAPAAPAPPAAPMPTNEMAGGTDDLPF